MSKGNEGLKRKAEFLVGCFPKDLRFKPGVVCKSRVLGCKITVEENNLTDNLVKRVLENRKLIKQAEIDIEEMIDTVKDLQKTLAIKNNELKTKALTTKDSVFSLEPYKSNIMHETKNLKEAYEKLKESTNIEKIKLHHTEQRFEVLVPFHQQILSQVLQKSKNCIEKLECLQTSSKLSQSDREKLQKTLKSLKNL